MAREITIYGPGGMRIMRGGQVTMPDARKDARVISGQPWYSLTVDPGFVHVRCENDVMLILPMAGCLILDEPAPVEAVPVQKVPSDRAGTIPQSDNPEIFERDDVDNSHPADLSTPEKLAEVEAEAERRSEAHRTAMLKEVDGKAPEPVVPLDPEQEPPADFALHSDSDPEEQPVGADKGQETDSIPG